MGSDFLLQGLVNGAVLAAVAFALSRFTRDIVGRAVLAVWLFGAAAAYVAFAVGSDQGAAAVLGEVAGLAIYGTLALRGLRGSPMWLAAGWALHPVWDIAMHYFGPGASFAPVKYTVSCLTFDLAVAAYVVLAYETGLVGSPRRQEAVARCPCGVSLRPCPTTPCPTTPPSRLLATNGSSP